MSNRTNSGFFSDLYSKVSDNWAILASVGYIYLTATGMLQSYLQLKAFNINVFDFAELNDFLLAAFREPLAIIAGMGMIVYVLIVGGISYANLKKKGITPRYTAWSFQLMLWFALIASPFISPLVAHTSLYGKSWVKKVVEDKSRLVCISLRTAKGNDERQLNDLTFIGSTEKFLFFYNHEENNTLTIPIQNIIVITSKPNKSFQPTAESGG